MMTTRATLISAIVSFAGLASTDANAANSNWKQFPPSLCALATTNGAAAAVNTSGQLTNLTGSTQTFICPVLTSSTDFTGQEATAIVQMWGYQTSANNVSVDACYTQYDSTSVVCNATKQSSTSVGIFSMQYGSGSSDVFTGTTNAANSYYLRFNLTNDDLIFGYDVTW
jgi:hypothetical protein